MEQKAFQDLIQGNHCWGCGPDNGDGLRIKSYWDGEESICEWQPSKSHMAGPTHVLNGGIIAALIDCHCICTAIASRYRDEGREIGSGDRVWYVTASIQVSYLKPTPITGPLNLRARIKDLNNRRTTLECLLFSNGDERARGEIVAVRVPSKWLEPG